MPDNGPAPMLPSGLLDDLYAFDELTPAIGRMYPTLQLTDLLAHEQADVLLRDLAIQIARRGVVFFKAQIITPDQQKYLTNRLGQLTGKPATSGLHIHPVYNAERKSADNILDEKGTINMDNEISVINSVLFKDLDVLPSSGAQEWHSDVAFENVPADYTSLKVHTLPATGGDTLWASGYEMYDIMSPVFQKLAEGLTDHFYPPEFIDSARRYNYTLHPGPRGAAENVGTHLTSQHPVVRTNPVTRWKSLYGVGQHFSHVLGVSREESELLRTHFLNVLTQNHTTQVRYRWEKNDLAIWDNRSSLHAATPDYLHLGPRSGVRAVSCGEVPFYDPFSVSRRADLGLRI